MSSLSWAARFGISDREVADLQNHLSATGEDALRWVLMNGHIAEREYMQWAMESYELPIVKDAFFQIPPDQPFWEAVRHEFPWNPTFLPLAEWQGVLLIGCLEPPRFHFPLRTAHRFVLVSPRSLEQRYYEYNPDVSRTDSEGVETAHEAVTPAPVVQEVRQRPMDEFLADSLPEAPDVSLENPDGLVHEVPPASTPNLFVVPEGLSTDDIGKPLSALPDGLEGTSVIDFSQLDENSVAPPAPAPVTPPVQKPAPSFMTSTPTATPTAASAPAPAEPVSLANRPYNEETAAVSAQPPKPTGAPVVQATAAPTPAAANVTPIVGTAKGSVVPNSVSSIPLETCATYDALGVAAIGNILKNFEQGVILMFQGGELRPWKWTEQLLSVKGDSPDAIPLDPPSIFRIAFRTCLPYHGYVIPNPTNSAFFNAFNRGILPTHTTVIPVLINGEIVGMLMGLSNEKVDYKASLIAMEKLASDFGTNLDRMRARKAA
jgi:hypothetical protein